MEQGIYSVAVRTCLSHEGDNLPRFTPVMGYSNHSWILGLDVFKVQLL